MYNFEELDDVTRAFMLKEFDAEWDRGNPFLPKSITETGKAAFRSIMTEAIKNGNEITLTQDLAKPDYWQSHYLRRDGTPVSINPQKKAEMVARTEFNTWYVRGLCKRLMEEGIKECQVYRADSAYQPRGECLAYEGRNYPVELLYAGHRARYWPEETANREAFSIPVGPNCHHTIHRVKN